ncbi:MAG: hypothetical protein ABJJ44_02975 [Paraglaciecola sp.]|uniref:hypothetical protein n=1 Tax=Paraglaciecola sp. TaxID=1920173 RepID=UPI00329890B3
MFKHGIFPDINIVSYQMKYIVLVTFFISFMPLASTQQGCIADQSKIDSALIQLAETTKLHIAKNKEFPGIWSHALAAIIEDTPKIIDVGGNVNPLKNDNSMQLECFNFKTQTYTFYTINLESLRISSSTMRQL